MLLPFHPDRLRGAAVAMLLLLAGLPFAAAQPDDPYPVKVSAFASQDAIRPGDSFAVAVEFAMTGKFHIYGPAENEGTPTNVVPLPTEGFVFGEPVFPATGEMDVFGQKLAVYEKTIHVIVPVRAPQGVRAGTTVTLRLAATYAACDDRRCLPPQSDRRIEIPLRMEASGTPVKALRQDVFGAAPVPAQDDPATTAEEADSSGIPDDYPVRLEVFASQDAVRPGDRFHVAVAFRMEDTYHIYGPKEASGTPTAVTASPTPGFTFGAPIYPEPHGVPLFGATLQVYEKTVHVLVPVTAAADVAPGDATLRFQAAFAACDDKSCLEPVPEAVVVLPVRVVPAGSSVKPTRAEVFAAVSRAGNGGIGDPGSTGSAPKGNGEGGDPKGVNPVPGNDPVGKGADASAGGSESAGKGPAGAAGPSASEIDRMGFVLALLYGLAWGLGAGLSPCVYPMIPVTLAYFGSQSGQSRPKTLLMAFVYVAGIVVTYATLGLIVGRAGEDLGAYAANPWVVGIVVAVFVALALSMFGLYEIRLPSALTSKLEDAGSRRGGFIGSFLLGLVLGFVAAPCVGPFAGALIISAATKPPLEGFLMLSSFGFGMGVPLLFIAVFSATLPKPGMWMVRLKEGFGYLILGMAIYFALPLTPKYIPEWVPFGLAGVLGMVFATFLGAFTPLAPEAGTGRMVLKSVAVLAAIFAAFTFFACLNRLMPVFPAGVAAPGGATAAEKKIAWVRDFEEGMALAAKEKKPVYLDFTADW